MVEAEKESVSQKSFDDLVKEKKKKKKENGGIRNIKIHEIRELSVV